jgi:hypothetical protein
VNLLQQQVDAQQAELQREADDRRRAQAIGVYMAGATRRMSSGSRPFENYLSAGCR